MYVNVCSFFVCMYSSLLILTNILMVFDDLGLKWEMGLGVVVKEREMEIGYPTDVKHVAHIGLDAPSASAPAWVRTWSTYIYYSSFYVTLNFNA